MLRWGLCLWVLLVVISGEVAAQRSLPITRHKAGGIERPDTIAITRDTTSQHYRYVEALKALHIHHDTTAGHNILREIGEEYAPAQYSLSQSLMRHDREKALYHAENAYRSDSNSRWFLRSYAEALLYNNRREEAATVQKRLVELEPNKVENYYLLAWIYSQTGRNSEGIEVINAAETRFGRIEALSDMKLYMLYADGQMLLAEAEARLIYEEDPENEANMARLAEIYLANKKDSLVEQLYIDALRRDSLSIKRQVRLGQYYLEKNRISDYLGVMNMMVANSEWSFDTKYNAIMRLVEDRDVYAANVFELAQIILTLYKQYPDRSEALDLLGSHYIFMGDVESCLKLYKRHLADEPPHEEYYLAIIDIHDYLQQPDSSRYYTREALKRFPLSPTLYLHRGASQQQEGNLTGCVESFTQAEKYAQNDTLRGEILGYIGDIYHSMRERREALDRAGIRRDTARYPIKLSARKAKERCYFYYEKALLCYYDNPAVLNNYAYFLSLEGEQLERGEQMAARAVELQRNSSNLDTYAWILHLQGKHSEAQQYMRQALSLDKDESPDLQMHYGDILYALKSYAMAKTYWQRALQYGADAEAVEFRLGLLKREPKPKIEYRKEER